MPDNNTLDFNVIASDCLIATNTDSETTIDRLNELITQYGDMQIIAILNYFLKIEYRSEVLCQIIRILDKYRDSSSYTPLTELLLMQERTPNANYNREYYTNVRVLCAKALSNLKDSRSVHTFLFCLNNKDENYKIRLSCADALGRLGDKYAVTSLINVVSDEEEKSVYIKESAAVALGLIGDMRAVDSLVKVIEQQNGILDKFSYLKEKAIEALCRLNPNNDKAFRALKKSLQDDNPQVRINTIEALMEYNTEEANDLIKSMLFDTDDEVKQNAVIALYNTNGKDILDEIIAGDYAQICKDEAHNILKEEEYE